MVSEAPISTGNHSNVVTEKSVSRSSSSKKSGQKIPRRIHKAEREKLKRDHMNTLFLELGKSLEPDYQDKGKSSTLNDCIRLLNDLLAQVDCLRKENAALLSESHYVSVEKDELKEDNSALEVQIANLQQEMEKRLHAQPLWVLDPSQSQGQQPEKHFLMPVTHATQEAPIFVMPLNDDPQISLQPDTVEAVTKLPPNISKPHPRYPSPSDSWPSHILSEQPKDTNHITQLSISCTNSSTKSRED